MSNLINSRQNKLSLIPGKLKAMSRFVLAPQITRITSPNGEALSAGDRAGWMPYPIASDLYLRKGTPIGFVAGPDVASGSYVSFIQGDCPDFIVNPNKMWRCKKTFALRVNGEIFFIYSTELKTGTLSENRINAELTFGFNNLAFPLIGRRVGVEPDPKPFSWEIVPYQHKTVTQMLEAEMEATRNRIEEKKQLVERFKIEAAHKKIQDTKIDNLLVDWEYLK